MPEINPGRVLHKARQALIQAALAIVANEIDHPGTNFHIHYPDELWERAEIEARLLVSATDAWHAHIDGMRVEHGHAPAESRTGPSSRDLDDRDARRIAAVALSLFEQLDRTPGNRILLIERARPLYREMGLRDPWA